MFSEVQRTSSSAMTWLSSHGGVLPDRRDTVARLSRLGAKGRCKSNCERDLHSSIAKLGLAVKAKISMKPVRVWSPVHLEVQEVDFPMLLPEDLCLAFWQMGESTFRRLLFGRMSPEETQQYWEHQLEHSPWFAAHPAAEWGDFSKLASVTCYGDEVQCFKNSECGVISVLAFCSEMGWKSGPLQRFFLTTCWSEHLQCDETFADVIVHFHESMERLMFDEWPWSKRGYLIALTGVMGDLKWIYERFGLHNYKKNCFCSRCCCQKIHQDLRQTLSNFSQDPRAFEDRDLGRLADYSPLLEHLTIERLMHDVMHSQYLGTGKGVNGATALVEWPAYVT